MITYRVDLAYDGTGFHGFARQATVRTVQGELEAALAPFAGPVETAVAGRTDRGVHAVGQVVSFAVDTPIDVVRVARSLNRRLGPEIAVSRIVEAPDGFHARFSATGRAYEYVVLDTPEPHPFLARTAWHVGHTLDVAAMGAAAAVLLGEHDFAAFCRRSGDRSTVRLVRDSRWERRPVPHGPDVAVFTIEASSFCHQMVRSVVATCERIGRPGRPAASAPDEEMARILASGDRAQTPGPAPPHGLTLVRVDYSDGAGAIGG